MEEAKEVDRSGSVVLEHLLLVEKRHVPAKLNLDVKQVIAVGSWYLWWIRRQFTHDGTPPHPFRWPMSVLAITNNFHQANLKTQGELEQRWTKPDPKFVKLNVDASFYVNEGAGATAVVIKDERGIFWRPHANILHMRRKRSLRKQRQCGMD